MSEAAFLTLLNRGDSVLSEHFGKAKWIAIVDDDGQIEFEQNTALNGCGVVEIIARHGCEDVVFKGIGSGAYRLLQEAGIRAWVGPAGVPLPVLLELFRSDELMPAEPPEAGAHGEDRASHKEGEHGCSCFCGHAHT